MKKLIETYFPDDLRDCLPQTHNENIYIKGSIGFGRVSNCPHICLFDTNVSTSSKKGFFLAYLFKKDSTGFYLTFCWGAEQFKKTEHNLADATNHIKQLLEDHFDLDFNDTMDLAANHKGRPGEYEKGSIIFKYYSKDNIPSDDVLLNDLNTYFQYYKYAKEHCGEEFINFLDNDSNVPADTNNNDCTFIDYLDINEVYFDRKTIENYLLSLKVKPFVILTGNSGTGKTKLSQLFAEYSYKYSNNFKIIPVAANWTDNRNIFGYYNVISKKYQSTPALSLINKAIDEEINNVPFFLILDEMNLSHVERYFSDFLSAIESKSSIPLHNRLVHQTLSNEHHNEFDDLNRQNIENNIKDEDGQTILPELIKDENGQTIPPDLTIPSNLFVVGTVNVDETTYMFSPKVLDRANVLEFNTFSDDSITIQKYMDQDYNMAKEFNINSNMSKLQYLENPLSELNTNWSMDKLKENFVKINISGKDNLWKEISGQLDEIHEILSPSGFDFGFRVVNEIVSFMYVAGKYEGIFDNNISTGSVDDDYELDDAQSKIDELDGTNDREIVEIDYIELGDVKTKTEELDDTQINETVSVHEDGSDKTEKDTWDNWNRYFDAQIKQKILPKIHGSKKVLGNTLDNLLEFCLKENLQESQDLPTANEITEKNAFYYTSAKKIAEMREVLEKQRYVSFIN